MVRLASYILVAAALTDQAVAATCTPVPVIGSPLPIAAALGGVALVVRLLRRN